MSLRTQIHLRTEGSLRNSPDYVGGMAGRIDDQWELPEGTSGGEANAVHSSKGREVSSGANEDMDLQTIAGPDGNALGIEALVVLDIRVADDSAGSAVLTPGATNGFTGLCGANGSITIPPGGRRVIVCPGASALAVSGTDKVINIAASGGDLTYDRLVIGRDTT